MCDPAVGAIPFCDRLRPVAMPPMSAPSSAAAAIGESAMFTLLHRPRSPASPRGSRRGPRADGDRASSIIVMSNRGPDEWLATFADPVRAQAAIDRFTSNAYDLVIEGEAYRKRLKPKSPATKARQKKGGSGN